MIAIVAVIAALAGDVAPKFDVTVVAEAPLVANPALVRAGPNKTLWVVDHGAGGDSIVVLSDAKRQVFVEHLINVRGIVPLTDHRALVLEPPNLLDIADIDEDGTADVVRVIGAGLANANGLALTSDQMIHVAGAGVRFAWDGERATPEHSPVTTMTAIVANGGDGRLVIVDGPLVRHEDVRLTRGSAEAALAWCAPIGTTSSTPAALAICLDRMFCIAGDRRSIVLAQPVAARWSWSRAKPDDVVLRAEDGAGRFNDIDGDSDQAVLFVACGETAPARSDGRVLRLSSTDSVTRRQTPLMETPRPLSDEGARAIIRKTLSDKAIEVRAQALVDLERRLREHEMTGADLAAWSELLVSSPDCLTNEPRLARLVASALHALGQANVRAGQFTAPRVETSPLVSRALIDLKLVDLDEARSVIADLLRTPGSDATLDRVSAALRLNDRRPARLRLDSAPSNWSASDAAQLDPQAQRALRRIQWPGRDDRLMDPEPPPSLADVIERGRRLYSNCLTCHGSAGRGQRGVYPPLANSPYVTGDPARLIAIILHGLEGTVEINGEAFAGTMPPPPLNSDDDLAAILTYVRQAFGNNAEAVTKADVSRVRAALSSRTKPWTLPELDKALAK